MLKGGSDWADKETNRQSVTRSEIIIEITLV